MREEENFESVLEIDEFALDREWVNQPSLFMKYALMLAEAKATFAERKAKVEVVKAELELDIRQSPEKYDIAKVTEATVQATILIQETYKDVLKRMNKAKHRVDILQAVVDTLDHRKRSLENLVTLHMANYFSKPKERHKTEGGGVEESIKKSVMSNGVKQRRKQT